MASTSNYRASAKEFGTRLTALYKLKIFPRLGKEFAEELFKAGVDVGACINALSCISDAATKLTVATNALVALHKVEYTISLMLEGGFYTEAETDPLSVYVEKLIEALSELVSSIKVRQERVAAPYPYSAPAHKVVIKQPPVVKRSVVVHPAGEKPAPEPARNVPAEPEIPPVIVSGGENDPDGFSAPYKG